MPNYKSKACLKTTKFDFYELKMKSKIQLLALTGCVVLCLVMIFSSMVSDLSLSTKETSRHETQKSLEENDTATVPPNNSPKTPELENFLKESLEIVANNESINAIDDLLRKYLREESISERTKNCTHYFEYEVQAIAYKFKESESLTSATPLAFSHLIHHDVGIFEIYMAHNFRPQNSHCIFVDQKAPSSVQNSVASIVNCYQEVFMQDCSTCGKLFLFGKTFPVYWGHISILEADLLCLRQLVDENKEWSFFMNMAGSELLMLTNEELSERLVDINSSILEQDYLNNRDRLVNSMKWERSGFKRFDIGLKVAKERTLPTPPYNLTIRKGTRYVVVKRDYAEFILNHEVPRSLFNWMYEMSVPDESFFSTLATVDVSPEGNVTQNVEKKSLFNQCIRLQIWSWYSYKCRSKYVNSICQFGIGDLEKLRNTDCLAANKFNMGVTGSTTAALIYSTELAQNAIDYFQNRTGAS